MVSAKNEIINRLMLDEEKIAKILSASTLDEIGKIFESDGLKVTDKQLQVFKEVFLNNMRKEVNKLSPEERKKLAEKVPDEELEKLSGGINTQDVVNGVGSFTLFGAYVGMLGGLWKGSKTFFRGVKNSSKCDENGNKTEIKYWDITKNALGEAIKTMAKCTAIGSGIGAVVGTGVGLINSSEKLSDALCTKDLLRLDYRNQEN